MEKGANRDVTGISDGECCWRDRVTIALPVPGYARSQIRKTPANTFTKVAPDTRSQIRETPAAAPDTFTKVQKRLTAVPSLHQSPEYKSEKHQQQIFTPDSDPSESQDEITNHCGAQNYKKRKNACLQVF